MANDDAATLGDDGATLEDGAQVRAPASGADPNVGRRVGPYRLERLLAEGGMGAVYLALRQDDFEQRVALKLVHPELQTAEVLRRFAAERQILARLEHPNIGRILDGGTTDDALPYFVMEYVEGVPLDRYCDQNGLTLRQRLDLFVQVCEAVHFAHQNLVVHRDLKPSNILVTADGTPKLLDFGIAKILSREDEDGWDSQTGRTQDGSAPMTPQYASPEQLLGETVTTASDVYALGVLLYRLTSRRLPYRLGEGGLARWTQQVCDEDPPWPSAVAAEDARRLRGDLDAVVLKAMHKQPAERYASALQLAEDIGRHLADVPVAAYDAPLFYRLRKLARRRKLGLAVISLGVVFTIAVTVLWRQAEEQRDLAEQARSRAENVSVFLVRLFEAADPEKAQGTELTVREVLDRGREELADELLDAPETRAEVLMTLGTVYNNLGLFGDARDLKEEALAILAADPSDRLEMAEILNNVARLDYDLGDYETAEQRFREAAAMYRRLGREKETAVALRNVANSLQNEGRFTEALDLQHEALDVRRRLFGDASVEAASSLYSLGALHRLNGDLDEAEPRFREALDIYTAAHGREDTRVARVLSSLGRTLHARGRLGEARQHLEEALEIRRRIYGDEHVSVAGTAKHLAALLLDQGETEAAGKLLEDALAVLRAAKPPGDWAIVEAESVWGSYLAQAGRPAEAEPILLASYEALLALRGEAHASTRSARRRVEAFYEELGDTKKAAAFQVKTAAQL